MILKVLVAEPLFNCDYIVCDIQGEIVVILLPRGGKLHTCRLPRDCAAQRALCESSPPWGARRAASMCSPVALDAARASHPQPRVEGRRGTMLTCRVLAPACKPPQLRAMCAPVLPGRAVVPRRVPPAGSSTGDSQSNGLVLFIDSDQ